PHHWIVHSGHHVGSIGMDQSAQVDQEAPHILQPLAQGWSGRGSWKRRLHHQYTRQTDVW
ncbi:unnamed protein product, partial [Ectocarpus sp. 13 AM-2016]